MRLRNQRTESARVGTHLLAGFAVTLAAVALYSGYTVWQMRGLEKLQDEIIDRNRSDSLLLLRIENDLNSLGLAMRDMLDGSEPYPLTAYQAQFRRVRGDLEDAVRREAALAPAGRNEEQGRYLATSLRDFWDASDGLFAMAANGEETKARELVRVSLDARREALTTAVSRLLVENNATEQEAAARIRAVYAGVERNVYIFAAAMAALILAAGVYVGRMNRRMFAEVAALSARRSELAQQLISMQESTFQSISRELHDNFGQILTAIGTMLQRASRRMDENEPLRADLRETQQTVQETLEKVRTLSRALHPVMIEEMGLESAIEQYLAGFRKQTGIAVEYEKTGAAHELEASAGIHIYRVMQEALTNVAKHSQSKTAWVRLRGLPDAMALEVEDAGVGFGSAPGGGMGLISMRERAELLRGTLEHTNRNGGGALVRLTIPLAGRGD